MYDQGIFGIKLKINENINYQYNNYKEDNYKEYKVYQNNFHYLGKLSDEDEAILLSIKKNTNNIIYY